MNKDEVKLKKKPELLAPAGNLEKLKIAILYGADAVYIGGQEYGLRSNADNFSLAEIAEGVEFANLHNAKIYVTTNIFAHNENIAGLEAYLLALANTGITGIIVADPFIIETAKKVAPELELHISTQQSITNWQTAQFWAEEGATRVVLARELMSEEIKAIKDNVAVELEVFIHGALCIAYSGRCTLSNHMTARDSNRGGCCHSCRWDYDLYEGEDWLAETEVPFSMSPKDLSLLANLPQIISMGIDSLKIEGRMKSMHYVATVTSVYRHVIDLYAANPTGFVIDEKWHQELEKCAHRPTAPAFFAGVPDHNQQLFGVHQQKLAVEFVGIVIDYDAKTQLATIQQRNYFQTGDEVEFFGPKGVIMSQVIGQIFAESGQELEAARHPLMTIRLKLTCPVKQYDMMRRLVK